MTDSFAVVIERHDRFHVYEKNETYGGTGWYVDEEALWPVWVAEFERIGDALTFAQALIPRRAL